MGLEMDSKNSNSAVTGDAASATTKTNKAKENSNLAGSKKNQSQNLVNGNGTAADGPATKKKGKKNRNKSPPVSTDEDALSNGHVEEKKPEGDGDADAEADANANVVAVKDEKAEGGDGAEVAELDTEDIDLDALHDAGIHVNISCPGSELLTVQLSSMELVQEIHQLLMDREESCHRTCFSLQLDNVTLDNFAELKTIEQLESGSTIKVVEEPYTMREARIHVRHVRDLLKNLDPADAYNGIECTSLTYLNTITQGDLLDKKKTRPDSVDCTPPDYVTPGVFEPPLLPLHPNFKNAKGPQALKVLTTSAWNPPPGPRKLHGDLMYLYVITMEEKRYHISACSRGFFINQSTDDTFNPKPDNPSYLSHSLIDLLSHISPSFRRAFQAIQKRRTLRHAFERVATPYQVYQWASPILEHTVDAIRAEDAFSSKLGLGGGLSFVSCSYEEHIPGQTRDWNEELQTTRELPRKTLPERLLRERAIFKVHGDFVTAATRGAMAVIDGNVLAINPGEDSKMQMFIWNNIFFSLGFDVRDHYKELGGDYAAYVAPRYDLHGVRVYNAVDVEGLYTLGTVVIDYRGYRVTAQSIIPGILEREQEQSVVYGSIDFGKTVLSHPKYLELLRQAGKHLKILPHSVYNERDEPVELCSSVECKGIIGNDGRHYILDLLRTFPPDVNFLKLQEVKLSTELVEMGYPIEHRHKLCCLRQELLEAFVEDRYVNFIRIAAVHLQQLNAKKPEETQSEEKKQLPAIEEADKENKENLNVNETPNDKENEKEKETPVETKNAEAMVNAIREAQSNVATSNEIQAAEVVKQACAAVGSMKEKEFDFRFNPDVFSPGIRHVDGEEGTSGSVAKQKLLVQDAAEFLVVKQIPAFVKEHLSHSSPPIDGQNLTESLHSYGINVRYLGKVIKTLGQMPRMDYLYRIAVMELIVRATKHIYYTYMQSTDPMHLSVAISHFLNCLLTNGPINPVVSNDEMHKKRGGNGGKHNKHKSSKGGKGQQQPAINQNGGSTTSSSSSANAYDWTLVTPRSLWQQIRKESKAYWDWDLDCDCMESAMNKFGIMRICLLRAFCLKVGIQVLLREYNFDSKHKPTFGDDDIVNVFPVVKHISPRASDAYNFYTTGQAKIQQGLFKEGYELISEALNLLNNVFGAMHQENGSCLRMLARLSYLLGDAQDALAIQQRAVIMSERVNGIDNPSTILEYAHLSLYSFANGHVGMSLKLLYRARYLLVLTCGEDHPEVALIDSNISLILHALGEYELSLRFIEHALKLNLKYFGNKAMHVAVSYHLMARTQSCMGDFRSALNNEKETYSIYKSQLGEKHEKTRDSAECLRLLTQQAVLLQRKMNDIYSNGKLTSDLPPIHITPPSMGSVLEMLNTINGILFVQISQRDIVKVRSEIEKHMKANIDVNEAIKSMVAAANNNGESEVLAPQDNNKEQAATDQKLTNGDKVAVSS
ncbi:protein clueless isoform X1 [Drosophila miranda]|uniref:protein clueless isoform X1 n=1 Tax=Drosophila miranda TaxID=7229 RepID=UPI0007E7BAF4|nr:protein clueless isoform X1 [Drosophila miranda]